MKRISTLLIAAVVPVAFAAPSLAQEGRTLGTVVNGNTTTVFKAADTSDIDMQKLQTWSGFASEHPDIARELAYNPSLINNDSYTQKHPELARILLGASGYSRGDGRGSGQLRRDSAASRRIAALTQVVADARGDWAAM